MKIALYIREGREQVVLTPENEYEKKVLEIFGTESTQTDVLGCTPLKRPAGSLKFYRGEFYGCAGGWDREGRREESVIIVFDKESTK